MPMPLGANPRCEHAKDCSQLAYVAVAFKSPLHYTACQPVVWSAIIGNFVEPLVSYFSVRDIDTDEPARIVEGLDANAELMFPLPINASLKPCLQR